ncbi:molybdopterin-dependent oxidoreductase [Pseudoneobacillus rhizosphaerae]|uniref:Dimethyl sulfoxide reductase chain YnfF n=1 Tax=Pseudoneobacillus rhizosphaerae TaxID=2880968 RepID=A0A9C7GAU4_9BACI|nr:molybdopterin-dependent oxidoreductase [Pseudoneobacillus rhizosphaerae]CAG9609069.1 putative dimethyl sulfoxide reductase chain YnfF [Pseudoneobacillus rhizosphaerae]
MAKVYQSSCSLNCWDNCGFEVTVEDGKVVKVDGSVHHPVTKGKICGRGRMLETRTNSSQRLLYPLKKINGVFEQTTWELALDEIAAKMSHYKENYGSTSILHSHDYANGGLLKNLDQRFFNLFGGVTELTGSLCWGAGIEAQKWDFGDAYSHDPEDVFNSKHIIIWGRNVARTNMHFYQRLQQAKKNGAEIIVIDPIYNATAKLADQYLSVKPGMDGILAAGIMKEILRVNGEDRDFIENHSVGFKDLENLLASITFEEIIEKAEVSLENIQLLAKIYCDRPTSTYLGLGMQRYENGGNTIRLIDALVAISGNVGIAGGGANYGNLQVGQKFHSNAFTLGDRKQQSRSFTMMKQAEGILEATDPPVKMAFVTCGNPLTQVPDTSLVKKAFEALDTLVVMDQFMTDTAQLADYLLPVTTVFEEEDIYYSSMYHQYVNYGPKLVDAPGEAKSDLWIWTELAKRLGFGHEFDFTSEQWIDLGIQSLKVHGFTLEKLKQEGFLELPVEKIPWENHQFKTPSGKYEFTSARGELGLTLPNETKWKNQELAENYPFTLLTIHPLRSNHSQHYQLFNPLPKVKVEISIDIAELKGLKDGDEVKVWNDRGKVTGSIQIMKQAHPHTINIDEGIWSQFGGSVNQLTSNRVSDNGLGSTLYDCLVNIEKTSL